MVPSLASCDFNRLPNAPLSSGEFLLFAEAVTRRSRDAIRILFENAEDETALPAIPLPQKWRDSQRGFLWIEEAAPEGYSVIGAAVFQYFDDWVDETGNNVDPGWELAGVWFSPSSRRKGFLSRKWPWFLLEFGAFHVHDPNYKMKSFLKKIAHPGTPKIVG